MPATPQVPALPGMTPLGIAPYRFRVTFSARMRDGREMVNVELHRTKGDAQLRASALFWTIVQIEPIGTGVSV